MQVLDLVTDDAAVEGLGLDAASAGTTAAPSAGVAPPSCFHCATRSFTAPLNAAYSFAAASATR